MSDKKTYGRQFLASVLASGEAIEFLKHGDLGELFLPLDRPGYDYVRDFVRKHRKPPTSSTVKLHTGVEIPTLKTFAPEPPSYYVEGLRAAFTDRSLRKLVHEVSDVLNTMNDPLKARDLAMAAALQMRMHGEQQSIADFRDAYDPIWDGYVQAYQTEGEHLLLGLPSLDREAGGLGKGDVASLVGRPALGKTFYLLYQAMHGWLESAPKEGQPYADEVPGATRLLISMEMDIQSIRQRMAAMVARLPLKHLYNTTLSTGQIKKLQGRLTEVKGFGNPFWIVDGAQKSTVEDIWALATQLQPGAIFIDGGYLITHPTEKDRYRRVAENAELIKRELAPIAPVVVTWQFARTAAEKAKKQKNVENAVGVEDIAYADAIGQISSLVTGLFQADAIDTLNCRELRVLKGRKGEVGTVRVKWDFENMDFSEIEDTAIEDLSFL